MKKKMLGIFSTLKNPSNSILAFYQTLSSQYNFVYFVSTPLIIPNMPIKVISCDKMDSTTDCQNEKYTADIKKNGKLECQPDGYPSNDIEFQRQILN